MKTHEISAEKIAEKRGWFALHGISLSQWADHHNVNRNVLYQVLEGKSRCTRGESHRIAVLLGLRPKVTADQIGVGEQAVYPVQFESTCDHPAATGPVSQISNIVLAESSSNYMVTRS